MIDEVARRALKRAASRIDSLVTDISTLRDELEAVRAMCDGRQTALDSWQPGRVPRT